MNELRTIFDPSDPNEIRISDPELRAEEWEKLKSLLGRISGESTSFSALQLARVAAKRRREFDEMKDTFERILSSIEDQGCAGDKQALEILYRVAYRACAALIEIFRHQETLACAFAKKQFAWPMILWPHRQRQNATLEAFERLEIGSDVDGPLDHEAVMRERCNFTPARQWVIDLCWQVDVVRRRFVDPNLRERLLQNKPGFKVQTPAHWRILPQDAQHCVMLPKLSASPKPLKAWLDFALEIALRESGGSLRNHPILGPSAQNRANQTPRAWKDGSPKSKIKRENTWNTVADDVVKSSIKNAIKSLAKKAGPAKTPIQDRKKHTRS